MGGRVGERAGDASAVRRTSRCIHPFRRAETTLRASP
ncbi:hypothetical protein FRF71_03885 [Novosphingobium ginsenosidimutans]|uniref:Uncharacterized protein n=1 Tax=Novosphingobium ginsenosidimutans TaxID=1176536 RepID=A0A5B8SBK3_9SPHN|nr:hypothetical protein FRF71_03885 [Novosphingobium ginsenosidimutans]